MIRDYSTPEGKSLARDLQVHLNGAINFLVECRPLSFSMGNAIKHLKLRISNVDPSKDEVSPAALAGDMGHVGITPQRQAARVGLETVLQSSNIVCSSGLS